MVCANLVLRFGLFLLLKVYAFSRFGLLLGGLQLCVTCYFGCVGMLLLGMDGVVISSGFIFGGFKCFSSLLVLRFCFCAFGFDNLLWVVVVGGYLYLG